MNYSDRLDTVVMTIDCSGLDRDSFWMAVRENPPLSADGRKPDHVVVHRLGDSSIKITIAYPKPTTPDLIRNWHRDPSRENRVSLWSALMHGNYEFEKGVLEYQGRFYSAKMPPLNHMNEHLISFF